MNNKGTTQIPGILRELTEFELFYKENYTKFYYYAHRFVEDDEVCRDIVGDAFEHAWRFYDSKKVDNWTTYIYSYVRNQCIDFVRHQVVHEKYTDFYLMMTTEEDEPEEIDERVVAIRKALNLLTPKTRLILEECYVNKKKYREVADALEISESTVKKHIMQALKIIRTNIVKIPPEGVDNSKTSTSNSK